MPPKNNFSSRRRLLLERKKLPRGQGVLQLEGRHEGNRPCGDQRCMNCAQMVTGIKFRSTTTGANFYARVNATCKTANLVYLIECNRCKKQYVGETKKALHRRMNGHCSDVYCKLPGKQVAVHFNTQEHSFSDINVMVIEVGLAKIARRQRRERFWMYTLRTIAPEGMNLEPGRPTNN